jgi:hypothetical protein
MDPGAMFDDTPVMEPASASPDGVFVLTGLPRSGTTLLTAVLSVHSRVVASFEPLNAKKVADGTPVTPAAIAKAERNASIGGRILLVKEVAEYDSRMDLLRRLYFDSAYRRSIVIFRHPLDVFVSAIDRRAEWWNKPESVGPATLDLWVESATENLARLIRFALDTDATLVQYETLVRRPEATLRRLLSELGLGWEETLLHYQDHLAGTIVRGDRTVARRPQPIGAETASEGRAERRALAESTIAGSSHAIWVDRLAAFHFALDLAGRGIVPASRWRGCYIEHMLRAL